MAGMGLTGYVRIKNNYLSELDKYNKELNWYKNDVLFLEHCKLAIESGNGKIAFNLLSEHSDYDYEEFEIVEGEEIE
jgi:hypothetical protein